MVRVALLLLSTEQGGRRLPVTSGWRPSFRLGLPKELHDAAVELSMVDKLEPGAAAADALLTPTEPEAWQDLHPGQALQCFEGERRVGWAVVL